MSAPKMILGLDINQRVTYALSPVPNDYRLSVTLEQNVNASFTVPESYSLWQIVFSIQNGADIWVAYNDTAELPAGNTFSSTTSEQNPTVRQVSGGTVIDCLTADTTANVEVSIRALQP